MVQRQKQNVVTSRSVGEVATTYQQRPVAAEWERTEVSLVLFPVEQKELTDAMHGFQEVRVNAKRSSPKSFKSMTKRTERVRVYFP
uniref:Kinesin motor domain-containing protein n=1 Tax=Syphacia muris TaxID=451379 RepID=A0A0N5ASE5_9BILA